MREMLKSIHPSAILYGNCSENKDENTDKAKVNGDRKVRNGIGGNTSQPRKASSRFGVLQTLVIKNYNRKQVELSEVKAG